MAAKLKGMSLALCCLVPLAQAVQAENCQLSVNQPRVDYGVIRREAFVEGPTMKLETRSLALNVVCIEPSIMVLRFVGAADGQGFRFGSQGRFRLSLKHAQVDGHAVEWSAPSQPGDGSSGQLLPGQVLVARVAGMPVSGRRLTAQVNIDADLPSSALHVRNQTLLEGQGSFELVSPAVPRSR
ncbi:hypothetical protein C4J95_5163 [Pseudomonas orientalis]|uniref:hypothetical protein n=1 Tax=Pseudomonas orientalis TaxID=76758 RepID=UPI000F55E39D|nr:hypothetical protein [Pseudomonas orientalis]AZE97277.1 hypothetical protein C4J96_5209 [Pseudomonas orientalis]AZF02577.1 hypothetical protein C4J95_5163 [Pseudomonas orientalis]